MAYPKTFTQKETGDFKKWMHGNVDSATLARWSPDNECVYVNGVQVFAFYFEDEKGVGKQWNCKFGWIEKGML